MTDCMDNKVVIDEIRKANRKAKAIRYDVPPDPVNHPDHYETGKYECIDVMTEALGVDQVSFFCLGNAFKYIYRCMHKHDDPKEDVQKAVWYLNKFLELQR